MVAGMMIGMVMAMVVAMVEARSRWGAPPSGMPCTLR